MILRRPPAGRRKDPCGKRLAAARRLHNGQDGPLVHFRRLGFGGQGERPGYTFVFWVTMFRSWKGILRNHLIWLKDTHIRGISE